MEGFAVVTADQDTHCVAQVDLAPMDSGHTLRWLPGRGERGGDLLLYPAWVHHSLSLPPNKCDNPRTFISVFIDLGDSDPLQSDDGLREVLNGSLSNLVMDP